MSFSGFDIEDAILMNKASIERGFGRTIVRKKFVIDFEKNLNGDGDVVIGSGNYDGFPDIGQQMKRGDVLVNKHLVNINDITKAKENKEDM